MSQPVNEAARPATEAAAPATTGGAGEAEAPSRSGRRPRRSRSRQARVVIRKLGPWSVLKISLVFYFCMMMVLLLAFAILYSVLGAMGSLDALTRLARDLFGDESFRIQGDWIFTRLTVIGLVMVVVWSFVNLVVVFLYNLISDVIGGIEVTLAERR